VAGWSCILSDEFENDDVVVVRKGCQQASLLSGCHVWLRQLKCMAAPGLALLVRASR